MGEQFLECVKEALQYCHIRVETEQPAGRWQQLEEPAATVAIRNLDAEQGQVQLTVKALSPRKLGGETCQNFALLVVEALWLGKMEAVMGELAYLPGCDCNCIPVDVRLDVVFADDWYIGKRWDVRCDDVQLEGVEAFRAFRNQERRIIGAVCQRTPVGVTPGHGGWEIELVQWIREESDTQQEPFTLTLRDKGRLVTFTGCRWNTEEWDHQQRGLRRTRKGFALMREEVLEWIS